MLLIEKKFNPCFLILSVMVSFNSLSLDIKAAETTGLSIINNIIDKLASDSNEDNKTVPQQINVNNNYTSNPKESDKTDLPKLDDILKKPVENNNMPVNNQTVNNNVIKEQQTSEPNTTSNNFVTNSKESSNIVNNTVMDNQAPVINNNENTNSNAIKQVQALDSSASNSITNNSLKETSGKIFMIKKDGTVYESPESFKISKEMIGNWALVTKQEKSSGNVFLVKEDGTVHEIQEEFNLPEGVTGEWMFITNDINHIKDKINSTNSQPAVENKVQEIKQIKKIKQKPQKEQPVIENKIQNLQKPEAPKAKMDFVNVQNNIEMSQQQQQQNTNTNTENQSSNNLKNNQQFGLKCEPLVSPLDKQANNTTDKRYPIILRCHELQN